MRVQLCLLQRWAEPPQSPQNDKFENKVKFVSPFFAALGLQNIEYTDSIKLAGATGERLSDLPNR